MVNEFEFRILNDEYKENLKQYFQNIEKEIQKEGLGEILFQVVYELINNAIKANLKRIFFVKNRYSFDNKEEYNQGIREFKKTYQDFFTKDNNTFDVNLKKELMEAIEDLGLIVRLIVDIDQKRILIFVINNTKMLPQEEKRIRENLSKAMKSKDLIDFMLHYGSTEEEGEGLGLALVVLLIKEAGFKTEYFRVYKDEKNTITRIELPLSEDYISIREKWKKIS